MFPENVPALPPEYATPAVPKFEWTKEQTEALALIDQWFDAVDAATLGIEESFFSLTGPAGTGKTTLLREVVRRFPDAHLAAMTGKAALRMTQLSGVGATTLHSILYYPPKPGEDLRFSKLREPESYFIIVDESSMLTPAVFAHLQVWAKQGVRFLLVGDPFQLPPVITGEELKTYGGDYSVFTHVKGAALTTVMRNAGGVLKAATRVRESGHLCEESFPDEVGDHGYEFIRCRSARERAVDAYCADREDHLLITWRNANRMIANKMIRERLGHGGPLPDAGEPILIKRNGSGFLNGETVECDHFEDGPVVGSLRTLWLHIKDCTRRLLVSVEGGNPDKGGQFFDGAMPWVTDWRKYHADLQRQGLPEPSPITWGYVNTAHSAQGSEARRVTVFLEAGDERNLHFNKLTVLPSGDTAPFSARFLYTAQTRGKQRTTLIVGR